LAFPKGMDFFSKTIKRQLNSKVSEWLWSLIVEQNPRPSEDMTTNMVGKQINAIRKISKGVFDWLKNLSKMSIEK